MATSFPMPNSEHASGISSSEPPATPDAPHAEMAESTDKITAVGMSTEMPSAWQVAIVITEMVTEAPAMLMVAPSGMETE